MRQQIIYFIPALLFLLLTSCGHRDTTINGYTPKHNFYFKLCWIGDGKLKSGPADILLLDIAARNLKDSVFWDTQHNAAQGFFIRDTSYFFAPHLYTLAEGDSVQYLLPSAQFFKEFFKTPVPFFSEKDSAVKLSVKILNIISPDEYQQVLDSLEAVKEAKEEEEYGQVYNYITFNFKNSMEFSKDAFMMITQPTHGDSVKFGRKVRILYKGYFLDGRLADQTPGNRSFDFKMGQEGQVIEGLRLALLHLKKGEKAKIILPSRLAFGSSGSTNGSIAPYTPLLYDLEVLDVIK